LQDFSEGERPDSNRRPPGPQPGDAHQPDLPRPAPGPSGGVDASAGLENKLFPNCSPARRRARQHLRENPRISGGFSLVGATGFEPATFRPPAQETPFVCPSIVPAQARIERLRCARFPSDWTTNWTTRPMPLPSPSSCGPSYRTRARKVLPATALHVG
jgi:hypothetical protein